MDKKKQIEFPDCWEEVKPLEWLHLLKNREKLTKQPGVSLADVKRDWCAYVLRNRGYRLHKSVDDMRLVDRLAETLDWMWRTEEDAVVLAYDTTANLMPVWHNLHGPMSHGADLAFGEFRHAVAALNRFDTGHDPVDLRALCAILYRPVAKGKGCAVREPFREHQMGKYMGLVRAMPQWMQWGVYAWLAYFCEYLFTGTFIIDGLEVCFAPVFARSKRDPDARPGDTQSLGMNSILYSVAESGVFGNAQETDDTLLLHVMLKLLDDKQRADEMMRNLKK